MKRLLIYLKGYKKECILGPLFKLLEASFELLVPLIVASIVDIGIKNSDIPYVIRMCVFLLVLAIVGLTCSLTAQWFAAKAATGFSAKLRYDFLKHVKSLSYKDIDNLGVSTLITRMSSDIEQVQSGVNLALRLLLRSPFVVIGAAVMAFTVDAKSAIIFVVVIPILCLVVFGIMLITMPKFKRIQQNLDGVTKISRENLNGIRVIRAFCKENSQISDFKNKTELLANSQKLASRISALLNPITFIVVNAGIIALISTSAVSVNIGDLTQGQVLALYNYMSQILVELIKTADLIVSLTKAAACADRVANILDIVPSQKNGDLAVTSISSIEFKNVGIKYYEDSDNALSGVSFKASKGETIGIIGGTGSGKTTLINMVTKLYDNTEGTILVNDKDIKSLDAQILREKIAVVPQKSVLFKGSILTNLFWGSNNASESEMYQALDKAQATDFVKEKDGLATQVSQGGKNFSGGQRQRLSIARALVKKSDVLILDDSSSALDYATDAKLRKAMNDTKNPPITFIVSQRATSVLHADLILVLDDAQIVGQGRHEELLSNCDVYQDIYYSQFKRGENHV